MRIVVEAHTEERSEEQEGADDELRDEVRGERRAAKASRGAWNDRQTHELRPRRQLDQLGPGPEHAALRPARLRVGHEVHVRVRHQWSAGPFLRLLVCSNRVSSVRGLLVLDLVPAQTGMQTVWVCCTYGIYKLMYSKLRDVMQYVCF